MSNILTKIIYTIVIISVLFFGGRAFVFWKLKSTLISKIDDLKSKGILINYVSIESNSLDGTLTIKNLEVEKSDSDSVCSSSATIDEFKVQGVSVLSYLLQKKLVLSSIILARPLIQYSSHPKRTQSSVSGEYKEGPLKEIEIGLIRIDSGKFQMVDSASCVISLKTGFSLDLENFSLKNLTTDSLRWKMESLVVKGIYLDIPNKFYHATINQFAYSRANKSIKVDSLRLVPTLDRSNFAKETKFQTDQFILILPSLRVNDFVMNESMKLSFSAREVDLNFNMNVYRDKRYGRKQRTPKVLPMTFLNKLSFPLKIDSLMLSESKIVYEEYSDKNDGIGKISFNELSASISNIANDSIGKSEMKVHSTFMNSGALNVNFTFPHEKNKLYGVKGSLLNFHMPDINAMLEPSALIKIESGKMQAMKFNFQYDSKESNGELELRYSDLNVIAIKKEDKSENKIVSLIIKALVKKTIDKTDPMDKRTGKIHWERDTQKAILNYWWKSVFSGVKAVFGFENPMKKNYKK